MIRFFFSQRTPSTSVIFWRMPTIIYGAGTVRFGMRACEYLNELCFVCAQIKNMIKKSASHSNCAPAFSEAQPKHTHTHTQHTHISCMHKMCLMTAMNVGSHSVHFPLFVAGYRCTFVWRLTVFTRWKSFLRLGFLTPRRLIS